ncbi:hypothetical protein ES703_94262 [subsurface metagenome]
MPMVPPAARQAVEKDMLYLCFLMPGRATVPMVTAVARLSPQTAEKPAQPATEDMAKPPGRRPNHLFAVSKRSSLIPEW